MRERILSASFCIAAMIAIIGAAAVDETPVAGLVMFAIGVAYCAVFAYQNGGV